MPSTYIHVSFSDEYLHYGVHQSQDSQPIVKDPQSLVLQAHKLVCDIEEQAHLLNCNSLFLVPTLYRRKGFVGVA